LDSYTIAETATFYKKAVSKKYNHLYQKIREDVYPLLKDNPFFGIHIKKLKGAYKHVYRLRMGNYRLFYTVEDKQKTVFLIDIESRQDSYK
jgi:mRNA interferase RelE/StbE